MRPVSDSYPLVLVLLAGACKINDPPPVTGRWADNFERGGPGDLYFSTGDGFAVANGALSAHGAHNHPLWLRKKLPRDARIELDAWSTEQRGDIKIELFGDGHSYDPDGGGYTATGYELIFGGWYNSKSIIARLDEHGKDIVERKDPKVVANQHYHWKIERQGKLVRWYIDDMASPFLQYDDPHPLDGPGHEYLAFNNWETDTWFDNLVISPL